MLQIYDMDRKAKSITVACETARTTSSSNTKPWWWVGSVAAAASGGVVVVVGRWRAAEPEERPRLR
jgi:hypothetical protein